MPYESPGDAFGSAFEGALQQQAAQRRQAVLDAVTVRKEQMAERAMHDEMRQAKDALEEKRREAGVKAFEKEGDQFDKHVQGMMRGDTPDAPMIALDKKHGRGYFTPIEPGGNPVYVGTLKERESLKQEKKVADIMERLKKTTPGSPEAQQLGIEYEMTTNKSLPAAAFKAPGGDTEQVARTSPDRQLTEIQQPDGSWKKVGPGNQVQKGAHWLIEPTPKDNSAKDAREAAQFNTVHEQAIKEVDGWAIPVKTHLEAAQDLSRLLTTKSPVTDRLVSPLVLKAIISGNGTGFRMTRGEIDNVTHGRSRWDDLNVAVNQWSADPTKALSLSDTQREDLLNLSREVRDRAKKSARSILDARHKMDDAQGTNDTSTVNKERTRLWDMLNDSSEDTDTNAGTMPAVGSTFNGGKVLKITPVK